MRINTKSTPNARITVLFGVLFKGLIIKSVVADGVNVLTCAVNPAAVAYADCTEVKRIYYLISLKSDFSRYNCTVCGGLVNRARFCRGKLCTVLKIKDYTVDSVWECRASRSADNNVTYRNLSAERLSPALCRNNA